MWRRSRSRSSTADSRQPLAAARLPVFARFTSSDAPWMAEPCLTLLNDTLGFVTLDLGATHVVQGVRLAFSGAGVLTVRVGQVNPPHVTAKPATLCKRAL